MFRGRPLTCPDDGQTRAVEHEMEALAGRDRSQTALNRTGFLGDLITWEDGVYGTSKSVFSGGA